MDHNLVPNNNLIFLGVIEDDPEFTTNIKMCVEISEYITCD